jgi:aryl-alcohol dehydrogenase-like predicted oxidoreductase
MEKRRLGRTGLDVSVLGYGCAPVAYLKADQPSAAAMIESLLDKGINFIDTATSYPGSHEFIGNHLSRRRDDFVLVSKCGQKVAGVDGPAWSPQVIAASVDLALDKMKVDNIDVMLLHSCDLGTLEKGDAIDALVRAREAGKIKHVGYSGDNQAAAWAAAHPEIEVIETSINIADQNNIDNVLPVARENDVGVIVKRPIANASWKSLEQQKGLYKTYAATYTDRLSKMNITPADLGFDGDPTDVWPMIALRFTLAQAGVTTAIVGTTNIANAEMNLAFAAQGPLPEHVTSRLRAAFKRADPNGEWEGQT